jgi:hypothetical protein
MIKKCRNGFTDSFFGSLTRAPDQHVSICGPSCELQVAQLSIGIRASDQAWKNLTVHESATSRKGLAARGAAPEPWRGLSVLAANSA